MSTEVPAHNSPEPSGSTPNGFRSIFREIFYDLAGDLNWRSMIEDALAIIFYAAVTFVVLPVAFTRYADVAPHLILGAIPYVQILLAVTGLVHITSVVSRTVQMREGRGREKLNSHRHN